MDKSVELPCRKNDIINVDILNMGNDGEGIGRFDGYTLFVKGALPGEKVRVKVLKTKKHFGYAKLLEVLKPSGERVKPVCPVFEKCGGCSLQHYSYAGQLRYKEEKVRDCLERIGGFRVALSDEEVENGEENIVVMEPISGMDEPYHYRNKAQFPVGEDKSGEMISGFYAGHSHQIIPNTDCVIQHGCNRVILETILDFMKEYHIPPYDETEHKGLVRHVLTRVGVKTGEIMVCLVLNGANLPEAEQLVRRLLKLEFEPKEKEEGSGEVPCDDEVDEKWKNLKRTQKKLQIKSICINKNTEKTNAILGKELSVLYGERYIEDDIGDIKFRISPLSFYQVNPVQTEKLYSTALEYADLKGGEVVWDLYCGIGTISLFLAGKAGKVCGVEIVPQAIEDAKENAVLNGIENTEFFCGAAEEVVPKIYEEKDGALKADVVVLDPPRKGCDEKLLETVLKMEPEKIVYVSCDPATLARDLKYLCERGYVLKKVRPFEMFCFSGHVETAVLLIRKEQSEKQ